MRYTITIIDLLYIIAGSFQYYSHVDLGMDFLLDAHQSNRK